MRIKELEYELSLLKLKETNHMNINYEKSEQFLAQELANKNLENARLKAVIDDLQQENEQLKTKLNGEQGNVE